MSHGSQLHKIADTLEGRTPTSRCDAESARCNGSAMTRPCRCWPKTRTVTGRLWTYVRDDRPFGGNNPAAAMFSTRATAAASIRAGTSPVGLAPAGRRLCQVRRIVRGQTESPADYGSGVLGPPMDRPSSARQNSGTFGDHGRVQPSIRPGVAARRPLALMIFAAPFPIAGADFASDAPNGLDGAR